MNHTFGFYDTDPYFDAEEGERGRAAGVPCFRKVEGRKCYHDCCLCDLDDQDEVAK